MNKQIFISRNLVHLRSFTGFGEMQLTSMPCGLQRVEASAIGTAKYMTNMHYGINDIQIHGAGLRKEQTVKSNGHYLQRTDRGIRSQL